MNSQIVPNPNPEQNNILPEPVQDVPHQRSRLSRVITSAVMLGSGLLIGQNDAPFEARSQMPDHGSEVQEGVSAQETFKQFDIKDAYEKSEAVLDKKATPLVSVPLTQKDENRITAIEEKIIKAELYKDTWFGGFEEAKTFYKDVLSPSEIKFYYEKWPLAYDRSVTELNKLEATVEANNASFIGVVKTRSGIGYNIYEASTDDKHDPPEINARALDVVTSLLISKLSSLDQSVLPQAEIERLQTLARAGKLDTVSVNMIIADDIDACVIPVDETNILRQVLPGEKCDAIGLHIDSSELQDADTTPYRNALILIGRSSGHGHILSAENNTVAHELTHTLMAATTLTSGQRIAGSPEDNPWLREHDEVVYPLIGSVEELARNQGMLRKQLEIIKSDVPNNNIQRENGWELDFSDGETRTSKEVADNIEKDNGRGLKFACVTILEQMNSAGKMLNVTRTYDYPIVEGYDGDGWESLVNPGPGIKFFSAVPGPGDKPVVEEISFDPEIMTVMPIQVGGKGAEITTLSGELNSNDQSDEYRLTPTDHGLEGSDTPVATERINLPSSRPNKGGGGK